MSRVGGGGARVVHAVVHDAREVHGELLRFAPLAEAREHEQFLDHDAHPLALLLDAAHGQLEVLGVVLGAVEHLGVAADAGKRRAQLVRGVRQEAPQLVLGGGALRERHLDATEHRVQAEAEPADLRPRLGRLHPQREVAGGDGVGRDGHLLERPQVALDQEPGGHGEDRQHHERDDDLKAHELAECLLHVGERDRGDHGARELGGP